MMTLTVFLLLIIYQLKHLIADYYWQYPNMYLNKGKKTGWLIPLASHASVHAIMTYVIAACYDSFFMDGMHIGLVIGVTLFDFTTHFVVDRWKATQGVGPDTSKFWNDLGLDQMLHHIVGIIIIMLLVS